MAAGLLVGVLASIAIVALTPGAARAQAAGGVQADTGKTTADSGKTTADSGRSPTTSDLRKAYDDAFQAMLKDIGNLDKTFAFAELAVKMKDFEGAIAALERMLLINPNLPRVRLELGVLYYRLGSFATARRYFTSAIEGPDVPPEVRKRVAAFLAEIDQLSSPNRFGGSIYAGIRWQSNANSGPSDTTIRVGGIDATLNDSFTAKKDWNAFAAVTLQHVHDFQRQDGMTLETGATLYGARQAGQKQLDVDFVELTSGPRLKLLPTWFSDTTLRPYVIADLVRIDDGRDFWATGAGINLTKRLDARTSGNLTLEARDKRFRNYATRTSNTDRNGVEYSFRLQVQRTLTDNLALLGEVDLIDTHARAGTEANREYSGTLGLSYRYEGPFSIANGPWSTSAGITRAFSDYRRPDPTVDPNNGRQDHDLRVSLVTAVPLSDAWTLVAALGRNIRNSTLPNYVYRNSLMSLGASWRF